MFGAYFFRAYMFRAYYFTGSAGPATGGDDGWLPYYVRRRHHRR